MTVISIVNAMGLFLAFDNRNPRRAGFTTAIYVISFMLAYISVIYIEYYMIAVGPAWKKCIQTALRYNQSVATGPLTGKKETL
jgi:hypothetical protein